VITESPALYFEIQRANPHSAEILDKLNAAVREIADMIASGDQDRFRAVMEQSRSYLEEGAPDAQKNAGAADGSRQPGVHSGRHRPDDQGGHQR
jgi:hypothetical protein